MDELAARYGFTYEIAKADIDEKAIRHEDAQHLVRQRSCGNCHGASVLGSKVLC